MRRYLQRSAVIDWDHPEITKLAGALARGASGPAHVAKRCFEWVRDEIQHSYDFHRDPITSSASEVLIHGTGYCYAKSHLLAALLRANAIPAGICYQRLTVSGEQAPYCLHSLNAVHLDRFGWYRIDARGNSDEVHARFAPPMEYLAYRAEHPGEIDIPLIFPEPLPLVVEALSKHRTWQVMYDNLPDLEIIPNGQPPEA